MLSSMKSLANFLNITTCSRLNRRKSGRMASPKNLPALAMVDLKTPHQEPTQSLGSIAMKSRLIRSQHTPESAQTIDRRKRIPTEFDAPSAVISSTTPVQSQHQLLPFRLLSSLLTVFFQLLVQSSVPSILKIFTCSPLFQSRSTFPYHHTSFLPTSSLITTYKVK